MYMEVCCSCVNVRVVHCKVHAYATQSILSCHTPHFARQVLAAAATQLEHTVYANHISHDIHDVCSKAQHAVCDDLNSSDEPVPAVCKACEWQQHLFGRELSFCQNVAKALYASRPHVQWNTTCVEMRKIQQMRKSSPLRADECNTCFKIIMHAAAGKHSDGRLKLVEAG